jgi:broad specificity phosphatase PhoE
MSERPTEAKRDASSQPPLVKFLSELPQSLFKAMSIGRDASPKTEPKWVLQEAIGQESADGNAQREEQVIAALKTLQTHLPHLTPAEQSRVKQELPFASPEWLDGLAISARVRADGSGSSKSETSMSQLFHDGSVHGGLARSSGTDRRNRDSVTNQVPVMKREESINEMTERVVETATDARLRLTPDAGRLILVLVGLPARGKSMLGYKLGRFLGWRGYRTRHFKVGDRRREVWNESGNQSGERLPQTSASFFDGTKAYASMTREQLSLQAFDDLLKWIEAEDGQVAIFDASNVTIARRAKLSEKVQALNAKGTTSAGIVFIESVVTDPDVISSMCTWKVRHSEDFKGLGENEALADLQERISHYEKQYQTVREVEGPYIKMFDLRAKVHACNIFGRMAKTVLPYLLAIHGIARPIFMIVVDEENTAHAETNIEAGLAQWARIYPRASELLILTSAAPRAVQAAEALVVAAKCAPAAKRGSMTPLLHVAESPARAVSDDGAGTFEGKFGESVASLVARLEPVALEIEAAVQPVVLVAHEACCLTLRTLLIEPQIQPISERELIDRHSTMAFHSPEAPRLIEFVTIESGGYSETVHMLSTEPPLHGAGRLGAEGARLVGLGAL